MNKPKMKPILFSIDMVRAILEGRKTQTRRVIKPQPVMDDSGMWHWKDCQWMDEGLGFPESGIEDHAPYKPGDTMWVRETWYLETHMGANSYVYRASSPDYPVDVGVGQHGWRPSIFMPKEAARIFLRVHEVGVERLCDMSHEDCLAEGMWECPGRSDEEDCDCIVYRFFEYWDKLNSKRDGGLYASKNSPYVWKVCFDVISKEDAYREAV